MSFTAAYSELQSLADHGPFRGAKITDYDGLHAVHESVEIAEDTFRDLLVLDSGDDPIDAASSRQRAASGAGGVGLFEQRECVDEELSVLCAEMHRDRVAAPWHKKVARSWLLTSERGEPHPSVFWQPQLSPILC